jgi:hypothetical protein
MKNRFCHVVVFILLMAPAASAQKSFYNKEFKFGFKTPAGSKTSTKPDDLYAEPPLKPLLKVSLVTTGRSTYGADASVAAGIMTAEACWALSTADDDKPLKKKFGTTVFDKTAYVEGGMESVHPVENYRIFHQGTCYEIRLMVHMEKYPKHPVNEKAVFAQLYPILRTFYFR